MRPVHRLIALPTALLAMAALVAPTIAIPPERSIDRIDARIDLPAVICGFPVTDTIVGTLRHTTFFDADGAPVRMLDSASDLRFTFTNTETGASASFLGAASAHITPNPDGSLTVVLTGLGSRIGDPDDGSLALDAGRMVLQVSGDGPDEVVEAAGRFSGNVLPAVCEVLAG